MLVNQRLYEYKEYGETLIDFYESVVKNPPPYDESWFPEEIKTCLDQIKKFSDKTVKQASSPVKIGIMGEFSSGKTLLIGSLIGYADALPVSSTPTTGNVTAIHLVQQAELKTTNTRNFAVHYLSHKEVKKCLNNMLDEAEKRGVKLPSELIDKLKSLHVQTTVDSEGIINWCEEVWNQTEGLLEMRLLLREIVLFTRCYRAYEKDLCGRSVLNVEPITAKEGLTLGSSPDDILEMSFDELGHDPSPWKNLEQPSAEDLRNSFFLISLIDITVEVSKEIWDLSSLQGTNEFVLLDFPGLGASNSGFRDGILSLQAMKDVQTIILLLDGRRSANNTAAKIRRMLEDERGEDLKNRIIVGLGRFNQLELTANDENNIDDLLEEFSQDEHTFFEELLSEDDVLEKIKPLQDTIANARKLTTRKENIILLSQVYGLKKLAQISSLIQVCSSEFSPELDKLNKPEESQQRDKWYELSEILSTSSILRRQLSDFALDGGISRLRSLLNQHVVEHGMGQILQDTKDQAVDPLIKEHAKLKNLLVNIPNYIPIVENPAFLKLREAIENLIITYRQFQEELDIQPTLKNRKNVSINDEVKQKLYHRVFFEWSEWSLLNDNTKEGIISVEKTKSIFDDEDDYIIVNMPTKTDDFYPEFSNTVKEMQDFAHTSTKEAVQGLFTKLSRDVEPYRSIFNSSMLTEIESDVQHKFDKKQLRFFQKYISRAIDPINEWQDIIIKHSQLLEIDKPINPERLFPLARNDEKHPMGQRFDWDPDKKFLTVHKPFNHQIAVLRTRHEIMYNTGGHLVEYTSWLTKNVKSNFSLALNDIIKGLKELLKLKNEPLLRYLASGEEHAQSETEPWLDTLSRISAISHP